MYDKPPHQGQPTKTGSTMRCPSLSVVVVIVLDVQSVLVTTSMVNPGGEVVIVSVIGGSRTVNRQSGNGTPSHISGSRRVFRHDGNGSQIVGMALARCTRGSHCLGTRRVVLTKGWR